MINEPDLKVGSLIAPNMDVCMLGERFVVTKIEEEEIWCERYLNGKLDKLPNGWKYPSIHLNKQSVLMEWMIQNETLDEWKAKCVQ